MVSQAFYQQGPVKFTVILIKVKQKIQNEYVIKSHRYMGVALLIHALSHWLFILANIVD